ncbi:MAG: hypothetical protein ABJH07_09430 [Sedimentitalea sp.]|uniref:hypothetical protein n=1 Tax=Sedimentitalea sp. TaxID=2048915 RepID=UPI00326328DA
MTNLVLFFLRFVKKHIAVMTGLFFAILSFVYGSEYFIEEKRGVIRIIAPIIGLVSGAAVGGVFGWLLGGIGIAAMGGAIGLSAPFVAILGAIGFSVFLGGIGASVALFRVMRNPSNFYVNWVGLLALLLASIVLFWAIKVATSWLIKKLRTSRVNSN